MSTEGSGASRAGGDGFHNEDVFVVDGGLGLYVVCDGASGRPAGEVAARVAALALEEFVERAGSELGEDLGSGPSWTRIVEHGLRYAMAAVLDAAAGAPEFRGMATTVTMLLAHGSRGVIGHTGDSRAYLIRRGHARQLTHDHELTDAISATDETDPAVEAFSIPLEPGDTLVLCTDGAERVVEDPAIVRVAAELSAAVLASRIVSAAHRQAPDCDATAVVVRVRGEAEPGWLELSDRPRRLAFGHAIPAVS